MTDAQRRLREAEQKLAKIETRAAALVAKEDLTDSERAEIRELATAKVEAIRDRQALAALADSEDRDAVTTDDAENRELRSLQERARVGHYLAAAITGNPLDGASREY
ncbi:MAG: hypothetical protein OXC72_01500 [Roseovarius sp.]|nr:hypothetical protein [Roseovarius sp.]MCY4290422.1 hypothetical protein [Roseovarius sp.]